MSVFGAIGEFLRTLFVPGDAPKQPPKKPSAQTHGGFRDGFEKAAGKPVNLTGVTPALIVVPEEKSEALPQPDNGFVASLDDLPVDAVPAEVAHAEPAPVEGGFSVPAQPEGAPAAAAPLPQAAGEAPQTDDALPDATQLGAGGSSDLVQAAPTESVQNSAKSERVLSDAQPEQVVASTERGESSAMSQGAVSVARSEPVAAPAERVESLAMSESARGVAQPEHVIAPAERVGRTAMNEGAPSLEPPTVAQAASAAVVAAQPELVPSERTSPVENPSGVAVAPETPPRNTP